MMSDLVGFINELVDDQIRMRTCIPLTNELRDFYSKLMGRDFDEDSPGEDGSEDDESMEKFLMPKKRFARKVVSLLGLNLD